MSTSIPLSSLESSPSAKFAAVGDAHAGRITAIEQRQQTDTDGRALTFADGTPRMQWVISVEKPDGEVVALYAKGGKYKATSGTGESMLSAIGAAVRAAGASGVDVGAELAVAFSGTSDLGGGKQAKLYTAQYRAPGPVSVPVDLFTS